MSPKQSHDDHRDHSGDTQPDLSPSPTKLPPARLIANPTDPFYERLSLRPALKAIVACATRRIKPRSATASKTHRG